MLGMISVLRSKVEASSAKELFKDSVRIPLESLCRYMSGVRIPTREIKWFWKSFVIFSNSFKIRSRILSRILSEFFREFFQNSYGFISTYILLELFWNSLGILLECFRNYNSFRLHSYSFLKSSRYVHIYFYQKRLKEPLTLLPNTHKIFIRQYRYKIG